MQTLRPRIWKVLLVLFIIALIATFLSISSKPTNQDQSVSVPKGAAFKTLVPGQSTKSEAIEKLGELLNDKESATLNFKSSNPNLPHQVVTEEEKITFIKEVVAPIDGKTSTEIVDLYGVAPYILYGSESIHGFNLYIYPNKGLSYIGHLKEPVLLEVWYFQPTTFEDFKDRWAPNYTDEPQRRQ